MDYYETSAVLQPQNNYTDTSNIEKGYPYNDETEIIEKPIVQDEDEILELGNDFDFDGFEVVRREFFAHTREPSVTFNNCKFYVNSACLTKFPTSDYAQVLINREKNILALRPCPEATRDSFPWCTYSKGRRKPKQITCKLFFAKIVALMNWNPDHRYKLLGKIIHSNEEYLIAFDLSATEVYQRTQIEGEEKPKTSRIPVFPAEWKNQFGLPYNEHKSMQINIVDGYAVYSIKDSANTQTDVEKANSNLEPQHSLLSSGEGSDNNI